MFDVCGGQWCQLRVWYMKLHVGICWLVHQIIRFYNRIRRGVSDRWNAGSVIIECNTRLALVWTWKRRLRLRVSRLRVSRVCGIPSCCCKVVVFVAAGFGAIDLVIVEEKFLAVQTWMSPSAFPASRLPSPCFCCFLYCCSCKDRLRPWKRRRSTPNSSSMMPFPPTDWSSSPSLTARTSLVLVSVNCLGLRVCLCTLVSPPFLGVCSSRAARVFVFSWPLLFLACFVPGFKSSELYSF